MLFGRDQELAVLNELLTAADSPSGRVVLIRGEAGAGKSALVREFAEEQRGDADVLFGWCDDLTTPQPLGPFWDIARDGPSLGEALGRGDRRAVWEATFDLLQRRNVLVLEDTQWADEATLDAIRYLGRRIARTKGLLLLTYRDGEVDFDHPLRTIIGELPPQNLVRIHLDCLSTQAVAIMVADTGVDLDEVMALTDGNPLFVTEVLKAGIEFVPSSIQDSVLARAAKLSSGARRLVNAVSVIPGGADRTVISAIVNPTPGQLAEVERQGLLRVDPDTLSFHHELTRRTIESSLTVDERRRVNKQVLTALAGSEDWSQLVHHSVEANDVESLVEFTPKAARAAMAIESHHEAAAHFRAIAIHLGLIPDADRAGILEDWAREEFYIDGAESLGILNRAIELHRSGGDDRALARALTFAVRVNEGNGCPDEADHDASEAVAILETYPPGADLAYAISQQAWLRLMRGDDDARGIDLADRAIAIAEDVGDDLTVIRALILKGCIEHSCDGGSDGSLLEEGLRRAVLGGYRFEEAYALINMAGTAADSRDVERAADLVQRARVTAARYEIRPLELYAQVIYAEILAWKGDWTAAEDTAADALGSRPPTEIVALSEIVALRVLATIQMRRGRPDARAMLDRMWSMAVGSGELQQLDPAASVLAEHLWLTGEDDPLRIVLLREVMDRSIRSGHHWPSGALAFWMWKLGLMEAIPESTAAFYKRMIQGQWQEAAAFWESRGVPYERGLTLMHGDNRARIQAVEIFETLGAAAAADRLRADLLESGVRVPRGRAQSTRDHVAGLTARQAEVLALLAEGLTNAQIADQLFVSPRTVENHVSAILMKLDASSRDQAVDAARHQGLVAAR